MFYLPDQEDSLDEEEDLYHGYIPLTPTYLHHDDIDEEMDDDIDEEMDAVQKEPVVQLPLSDAWIINGARSSHVTFPLSSTILPHPLPPCIPYVPFEGDEVSFPTFVPDGCNHAEEEEDSHFQSRYHREAIEDTERIQYVDDGEETEEVLEDVERIHPTEDYTNEYDESDDNEGDEGDGEEETTRPKMENIKIIQNIEIIENPLSKTIGSSGNITGITGITGMRVRKDTRVPVCILGSPLTFYEDVEVIFSHYRLDSASFIHPVLGLLMIESFIYNTPSCNHHLNDSRNHFHDPKRLTYVLCSIPRGQLLRSNTTLPNMPDSRNIPRNVYPYDVDLHLTEKEQIQLQSLWKKRWVKLSNTNRKC